MSILELFCSVDDFWQTYGEDWQRRQIASGEKRRMRQGVMHPSEIMTLLIHFHQARYRTFKAYYQDYVRVFLRQEFPTLVSYQRFVELMSTVAVPLAMFLQTQMGTCTGVSFVDSTPLTVCKNPRISSHKVFAGLAARGKTSTGWFFGFKLHLVINDLGEILALQLTPGNVDDRVPVPTFAQRLFGKLFADKGYVSQLLAERLQEECGVSLFARHRKNMTNVLIDLTDKLLLRKRAIIESVNDQLKNLSQIEHSRHRRFSNFRVNLICGLIAYCRQPKKPSLQIDHSVVFAA